MVDTRISISLVSNLLVHTRKHKNAVLGNNTFHPMTLPALIHTTDTNRYNAVILPVAVIKKHPSISRSSCCYDLSSATLYGTRTRRSPYRISVLMYITISNKPEGSKNDVKTKYLCELGRLGGNNCDVKQNLLLGLFRSILFKLGPNIDISCRHLVGTVQQHSYCSLPKCK
jgi:hypothetical protein